jgi:hypothetical protein
MQIKAPSQLTVAFSDPGRPRAAGAARLSEAANGGHRATSRHLSDADKSGGAAILRLYRTQRVLQRLEPKPLKSVGLLERSDLQRMIVNTPAAFSEEIGEKLLLMGEEISPTDVVDDRIDVLALDKQGNGRRRRSGSESWASALVCNSSPIGTTSRCVA